MKARICLQKLRSDDFENFFALTGNEKVMAKSNPQLKRIWANTDPNNMASRKILLKHGFISEKTGLIDGLPGEIFGLKMG